MAVHSNVRVTEDAHEMFTGVSCWMVCSVGMVLFNKFAVTAFPLECSLVTIQLAFTALFMVVFCWGSLHVGSLQDFLRWLMVVPFFSGMLLTSMFALSHASMTTVVIFRALAPLLGLLVERLYPNPLRVTMPMIFSMMMIVLGAVFYAHSLQPAEYPAVWWLLLNNVFAIGDRLLQRLFLAKDQRPLDISKSAATLINNGVAIIPLFVGAWLHGEFAKERAVVMHLQGTQCAWILISCLASVGISYCGIWAQSLISATSFLVLSNGSKFVILFIEVFVMRTKQLTLPQFMGGLVSIGACIAYGQARAWAEREDRDKLCLESVPELQAAIGKKESSPVCPKREEQSKDYKTMA